MNHFTFLKAEQQAGLSAKVAAKAAEEHQMTCDTSKFAEHDADVFLSFGNADVHAFFQSKNYAKIVLDGGQVVLTVRHTDVLQVSHGLSLLFHTAVDVTEVGNDFNDGFAIHSKGQTQGTVSTGVLGAHVHEEFFGVRFSGDLESRGELCYTHTGLLIISG